MAAPSSQFVDLMSGDFYKIFDDTLMAKEPYYSNILRVYESEHQYEKMSSVAGVSHLTEVGDGDEPPESNPKQKYDKQFTAVTFSITSRLTKNAMSDDRTGLLKQTPRMQAEAAIKTIETIPAAMFDRSQTGAYTGADGKVLCATDHSRIPGGTWSNRPTTNVDLGYTSLESGITSFESTVDDYNDPAMLIPRMLLIHQSNRFMAAQLLQNMEKVGTTNRDMNAIKAEFSALKAYIWPYITDTDSFYLLNEKNERQIFVIMREKINKTMYVAPDKTLDAIFHTRFRMKEGWLDPRGVWGTTGG